MTTTTSDSTTGQAREQAQHVAAVAGDEAKSVTSDVRQQARGLVDETRTQVEDQSRQQRDRLVETVRTFGDDLDDMAAQRSGMASDVMREVASRARTIGDRLDGREPTELLDDLRSFARRRPGVFLAGSLVAGVVVGRLVRGSREAAKNGTGSTGLTGSTGATGGTHALAEPYGATAVPAYEPPPGTMAGEPTSGLGTTDPYPADPTMPVDAPPTPHREVP